jgi:DNA-binding transcriptional regulator YhcF (GntR family)
MSATPALTLDRDNALLLRTQLRRNLAAAIRSGRIPAGATLPSVLELADQLGISAGTVRNAVLELGAAGLVRGNGRAGTKVQPVPLLDASLLDAGAQLAKIASEVGASMEDAEAAIIASWGRTVSDSPQTPEVTASAVSALVPPANVVPDVAGAAPTEPPTEPITAADDAPFVDDEVFEDGPWWELYDD